MIFTKKIYSKEIISVKNQEVLMKFFLKEKILNPLENRMLSLFKLRLRDIVETKPHNLNP